MGMILRLGKSIIQWFDAEQEDRHPTNNNEKIDWYRVLPFVFIHLACFGVIWVGFSTFAFCTAVFLYLIRMFAITGFYHRYFSHRAFKTNRCWQFIFALIGASATQRGALWWAAHHRYHHRHSDKPEDMHSPHQKGFWQSHMGWFLSKQNFSTKHELINDLITYPELRFLNRFDSLIPILFATSIFFMGEFLAKHVPQLHTDGWQLLIWGYFISTVVLFHATFAINSFAHQFGSRPYNTKDNSRNNLWLALLTLGEGWHNNHHYYPGSAKQGFNSWQIDITYYILYCLEKCKIIYDLRAVPDYLLNKVGKLSNDTKIM